MRRRYLLPVLLSRRITASFSCTKFDQEQLGSSFAPDYWNCVKATRRMDQIEECISTLHPNVASVSDQCNNCISTVFLLNGSSCIIDCRKTPDSDACVACQATVASQWSSQCAPSGASGFEFRFYSLIMFVITLTSMYSTFGFGHDIWLSSDNELSICALFSPDLQRGCNWSHL
ncbi:hypothetical protein C9890_0104 [Perkinsus sp. BL_2016]|nr:hypothetical protein C9890_0104 [Perkinsus sp. BL_2016]